MEVESSVPEVQGSTASTSKPWKPTESVQRKAVYIASLPSYEEFFQDIFLKNQLCIIGPEASSTWASRTFWVSQDGRPEFCYLDEHFGDVLAPVANCNAEEFCAHPKTGMKVKDYLAYWQNHRLQDHPKDVKCLYLKDWHFTKAFPSYSAYTVPAVLCSDWMNEFWDVRKDEVNMDDYRFVYMGPKHSWTPFHADVLRSYSWSANICGQKKWIFYPPGEEEKLKDRHGQLVFDLLSDDLHDTQKYPDAVNVSSSAITVIQNPGEIIFVPSGWHHQVFNTEDTISINHNWMNGCSAHLSWEYIKERLAAVKKEIADCEGMDGWHTQCQMILKADSGMDYTDFYNFMATIAEHRIKALRNYLEHITNKGITVSKAQIKNQPSPYVEKLESVGENFSSHKEGQGDRTQVASNSAGGDAKVSVHSDGDAVCEMGFAGGHKEQECGSKSKCSKILQISETLQSQGSTGSAGPSANESVPKGQSETDTSYSCIVSSSGIKQHDKRSSEQSGSYNSDKGFIYLCLFKDSIVQAPEDENDRMAQVTDARMHKEDNFEASLSKTNAVNSFVSEQSEHKSCPHWAHCGPNLAVFDLYRVLDIVEDMQSQSEFKAMMDDETSSNKSSIPPLELTSQIRSVIKELGH